MLVSDIVRRNADFYGDREAVVVPGRGSLTWAGLEERTNQLARAFLGLGLGKGDRVATYAPNCGEYIEFFFGCAKSGVIGSTTNIRLAPAELVSYLNYVEPSAILVHADLVGQAGWVAEVPSIRHVIGVGEGHGFDLDYAGLVEAQEGGDPGCAVDDTDTYQLGATSGTTGIPKGAVLTHRNAIAAMLNWMADMPYPPEGTNLQNIPLFFNPGGPAGMHPVLMKGGRTVIFPAFEPGNFLRAVPEYRVTHSILVPTMVGMVLAHPECEQHDLSSIMAVSIGGSPLPREVLARAREVFGDVFFPMYGMAESYSSGLILRREDQHTEGTEEQVRRLGSAGKPMVLNQVRVVDEHGVDVPRDNATAGEVWLKGDTLSPEYFRMPEETVAARSGEWFKSGDLATVDPDGFVTIVDRLKDMIITGGINVFSVEVEKALYGHPAVGQVAVIGVPHDKWGEAIHALVVPAPGQEATPEELMAFAAERLADYKKPRSLEIVDELPVGGTGKILKKELRERYWTGHERPV
ncbi:MAG: AMP-binding protein [Acidimicrobiia bacterium]|nr:AMP-binding protein [Acidimicrobiia bacterium]